MNNRLLSFFRHLVSTLGITLCSKCGARTKLDKKLGHYITESNSKCPKCGNIDNWGSGGATGDHAGTGGFGSGGDGGGDGGA